MASLEFEEISKSCPWYDDRYCKGTDCYDPERKIRLETTCCEVDCPIFFWIQALVNV